MNKQKKQMVLLLVLLTLIGAGYFILSAYNRQVKEKESQAEFDNTIFVVNENKEDIEEITYNANGQEYTFKNEGDQWVYATDSSLEINQSLLDSIITKAAKVKADYQINDVTDLSQYGLENPITNVEVKLSGKTYHLHIGDYNATIAKYYMYGDDASVVYTVESNAVTCYQNTLENLKVVNEEDNNLGVLSDVSANN